MPSLTIVAGPNGTGKSTITAKASFEGIENLIDPDAIARRLNPADPGKAAIQAAREAISLERSLLASRHSFTVETTLAGNGTLELIRQAKQSGYIVSILYIAPRIPRRTRCPGPGDSATLHPKHASSRGSLPLGRRGRRIQ